MIALCLFSQSLAFAGKKKKDGGSVSVITIDRAESTEYRKDEKTGDDKIILSGDVGISVEKDSTKLSINADQVTYNRATEILYAEGNISLVQTDSSDNEQTISASTLLLNTSTLEGVFDNGRAVQTKTNAVNLPSDSTLIVASAMFSRSQENSIVFKNASLTFCDEENPHWRIKASRIWLLPGGEFAFFNGLLYVGEIPLLYLPAFYYPKDELVFNPVFGYEERKGYYIQTTTYLLGRKPLGTSDSSNSSGSDEKTETTDSDAMAKGIFNFMKPSTLKKQKLEGLVLHNLEEDFKGDTTNYLKLIGDYYTNLGGLAGIEGNYKPTDSSYPSIFGNLRFGFSNTVFFTPKEKYTNYGPYGRFYVDKAHFLGCDFPFRFMGDLEYSMSKPFSYKLSLPMYSDPYFTEDFDERSEYLDWISFLMTSGSKKNKDEEDTSKQQTTFTWNSQGSISFPLPDEVQPWLSVLSFSNISTSVVFNSKTDRAGDSDFMNELAAWRTKTPERGFFYPSQVTPLKFNASIGGSFFKYPFEKNYVSKTPDFRVPLDKPEALMFKPDFDEHRRNKRLAEIEAERRKAAAAGEDFVEPEDMASLFPPAPVENVQDGVFSRDVFPVLKAEVDGAKKDVSGINYSLDYLINPQFTSQLNYKADNLYSGSDFDWNKIHSSYIEYKNPVTVTSNFTYGTKLFGAVNSVTFSPEYQDHPNVDGYSQSEAETVLKTDLEARKLNLTSANTFSVYPFYYYPVINESNIALTSKLNLVDTKFIGDVNNPEWDYILADLSDIDCVPEHYLTTTFSAKESEDFSQVFALTSNLPPRLKKYTGNLALTFPHLELKFQTGLEEVEETDSASSSSSSSDSSSSSSSTSSSASDSSSKLSSTRFKWNQFQQSANLKFFSGDLTFTESLNIDLDEGRGDSLKFSAAYKNLSFSYEMQYTTGYKFETVSGSTSKNWVANSYKEFLPYTATLAFVTKDKTFRTWKNRITFAPALNSSLVYDFIKPTSSYFKFVPSLTFKVFKNFDLIFSSETTNNVVFRYVQDYCGYPDAIPGEKNVFVDLFNSFAFWGDGQFIDPEQSLRKGSGFKLKNFKVSLTRKLCDWDLVASLSIKPRLEKDSDGKKHYDYHPYFSFMVSWRPMSSMKTQIVDEYGEWKLNP